MINIGICDDDIIWLDMLSQKVTEHFHTKGHSINLVTFLNIDQLQKYDGPFLDLLLLDIIFPDKWGTEFAKHFSKQSGCEHTTLIFVSSYGEAAFECYRYNAFRFIRKDRIDEELQEALDSFELRYQNKIFNTQLCINDHYIYTIDIKYIETSFDRHNLLFHTEKEEIRVRGRLSYYYPLLKEYGFGQPHQSYLVNYSFIQSFRTDTVILKNNLEIPMSRTFKKAFKNSFLEWKRKTSHVLSL